MDDMMMNQWFRARENDSYQPQRREGYDVNVQHGYQHRQMPRIPDVELPHLRLPQYAAIDSIFKVTFQRFAEEMRHKVERQCEGVAMTLDSIVNRISKLSVLMQAESVNSTNHHQQNQQRAPLPSLSPSQDDGCFSCQGPRTKQDDPMLQNQLPKQQYQGSDPDLNFQGAHAQTGEHRSNTPPQSTNQAYLPTRTAQSYRTVAPRPPIALVKSCLNIAHPQFCTSHSILAQ